MRSAPNCGGRGGRGGGGGGVVVRVEQGKVGEGEETGRVKGPPEKKKQGELYSMCVHLLKNRIPRPLLYSPLSSLPSLIFFGEKETWGG